MIIDRCSFARHPALLALVFLTLSIFAPSTARAAEPARPNVLLIVSDDQGYLDAGFQGGKQAMTPNLDRLAASGLRCTSGYASHPFCSPTRAGLMAGRYQARFGHERNPVYDPLDENEGLPLSEKLLPQFMRDAGYRTGWVGKWHLGASPKHVPAARGFDETFGFVGGGHAFLNWQPNQFQYTLPLTRDGKELSDVPPHLTTKFGEEAAAFVTRNQERPWFLYLPFNAPHTPHQPTPEAEAKFASIKDPQRRKVLAQVALLDDAVGTVLDALDKTKQTKRTLIFFVGDNGGQTMSGADNGPLKKNKGTVYEGGVRVPFVVAWPGTLPEGKTYDQPVMTFDAFATALAVAGVALPTDRVYDGVNLLPYLKGEKTEPPHKQLCWRNARGMQGRDQAIRMGDWKLVHEANQPVELYNLAEDLGESKNIAADHPAVLAQLETALAAWNKELIEPVFPGSKAKSEDWGPGGANEKARKAKQAEKAKAKSN